MGTAHSAPVRSWPAARLWSGGVGQPTYGAPANGQMPYGQPAAYGNRAAYAQPVPLRQPGLHGQPGPNGQPGPYGQPVDPRYGAQPPGYPQAAWGAPARRPPAYGWPTTPPRRRTGLIIGIIAAVVVVVLGGLAAIGATLGSPDKGTAANTTSHAAGRVRASRSATVRRCSAQSSRRRRPATRRRFPGPPTAL